MKKITSLILAAAMIFVCLTALTACGEKMGEGACEYLETRDTAGRDIRYVEICVKNYGKMVIMLDATTAPKTVENFVNLANSGFYNGLTFHRIIDGFMIQGGDPDANGSGGSEKEIYGEFSSNGHQNDISHKRGVISMARSDDENSASSQFFICHEDASSSLDGNYAAFGYVVEGMSVVDDIVKTTMDKCMQYYGNNFYYWLYYGNGSLTDGREPIRELQPKIKYVKVLDSWEK
ncbi:MAG: peptidylprolyl isomerase [Clostridia bacterium]|nr:peptidylprolyl isomerase [Clostridia bacterium]